MTKEQQKRVSRQLTERVRYSRRCRDCWMVRYMFPEPEATDMEPFIEVSGELPYS